MLCETKYQHLNALHVRLFGSARIGSTLATDSAGMASSRSGIAVNVRRSKVELREAVRQLA
jgi:hypothetical protein